MKHLDLHGVRHDEVDRMVENYLTRHRCINTI